MQQDLNITLLVLWCLARTVGQLFCCAACHSSRQQQRAHASGAGCAQDVAMWCMYQNLPCPVQLLLQAVLYTRTRAQALYLVQSQQLLHPTARVDLLWLRVCAVGA